ncbi:hypothetical protein H7F15_17675 [Pontibacter sp. Tf4]|uniref:hypothetical protein n=1 Tax=Pontibacter sp. Tf4 TaxID=2761620 RepID=UPI001624E2CD|nr:hypothetical protein [Pontibacter sp. Tf4]MBB6612876.1 hypothetical protein [Pontibacter sp. Tf4]
MKGRSTRTMAVLAAALLFYGCEKDQEEVEPVALNTSEHNMGEDCDIIDFESGATGAYINSINSTGGFGPISIFNKARNSGGTLESMNRAVLYDSDGPTFTGDDDDLEVNWGNVLIIQEIGTSPADGPNDNRWGGTMRLEFPEPVTVKSLGAVDIDLNENESYVYLYSSTGQLLDVEHLLPLGDASTQTVTFNGSEGIDNVKYIKVVLAGDDGYVGSGAIDDIVFCVPDEGEYGCTRTQGYWKTHSGVGKNKGGKYDAAWDDYLNATLGNLGKYPDILWMAPKGGDARIILAHQYIAAVLNVEAGASTPDEVDEALEGARKYFNGTMSASRAQLLEWAELLDDYNNGLIGPGSCDD